MTEPGHIHNIGFLKLGSGNLAKWYFPLAEARKKRKMFSHTRLGPVEIRVLNIKI